MPRNLASLGLSLIVLLLAGNLPAQNASKSPASSSRPSTHAKTVLDPGTITDGVYRNAGFGFSCKVPYGWVERTAQMQGDSDPGKGLVLLAAFERPPEATGDAVNSAIVIAAESVSSYPGLKTAADYFGPMTELITGKGFTVVNPPYLSTVDGKQLARGDYSKELGSVAMHQASLVMVAKGYVVSFTFIGGSEDEVRGLVEGLSFGVGGSGKRPPGK